MIIDQNRIFDGIVSFAGGQDASKRPNLIGEDQCAEMENLVCRGGRAKTRPGLRKLTLNFLNNIDYDATGGHITGVTQIPSITGFQIGLFQGAQYFDPSLDEDSIICSIGGRIFKIVPRTTTADVTELYLDNLNRQSLPLAYFVQADRFIVIQDGESSPIIYDGVVARRAKSGEIPVGTIMAYGQGRIVLAGTNRRDILFGDLFGSHPGDPSESILKFTETNFLSEGGSASIPFTMGHIAGMVFYPQQDTSMGQGELLVFAEKGMASFFLSLPRDQWKTSAFQRMGLLDIGGKGHRAFTPVNGDVWFRSTDGWRTYRQARAEIRGWSQLPLSNEVDNYVKPETQWLLQYASSIFFDNRLIVTSTPIPNDRKPYHNGLLSLDFNVLASFGEARKPSWDGHWSGIKATQLVEGHFGEVARAFAFGLDEDNQNVLYELNERDAADSSGPITSSFTSRSFVFQSPFNENVLYDADAWFDSVRVDDTTIEAFYRPDDYPSWVNWKDPISQIEPLNTISNVGTIGGVPQSARGFKPRRSFGKPPIVSDTLSTNRDSRRSYELQVRVQWTGNASMSKLRIHDQRRVETGKAEEQ